MPASVTVGDMILNGTHDRTAGCEEVVGIRFVLDSSLEGNGFELPVPLTW